MYRPMSGGKCGGADAIRWAGWLGQPLQSMQLDPCLIYCKFAVFSIIIITIINNEANGHGR